MTRLSPKDVSGLAILAQHRTAPVEAKQRIVRVLSPTGKRIAKAMAANSRPFGVSAKQFRAAEGFLKWASTNRRSKATKKKRAAAAAAGSAF